MSDARGCGANFYFDGVGRLLAEDYFPCSTTDHALYSAPTVDTLPSGDKLPASSAAGIEVLYTYDAYVPPAQSGLTFETGVCDPSNGTTAPGEFARGRLTRVSDLGAESYTVYDGRGRNVCATTRLTKPYAPTGTVAVPTFATRYAPRWYSQQFTYDAADRVVQETTGARVLVNGTNQSFVKTVYGPRGTVKQVQSAYGDLIAAIDRTADGLVTRVEYADLPHTATTYTFDDRRRVHTAITARAPPTAAEYGANAWPSNFETDSDGTYPLLLQDETFTYDVVGNPTAITDSRIPEEWPAGSKPVSRSFEYDDLYRVIKADYQYEAGDDTWKSPFTAELAAPNDAGDPRRAEPATHVAFAKRILWQSYQYDWLGNTRTTNDDAKGFYDRSLGTIVNGTTKAYQLTSASHTGTGPDTVDRSGSLATTYDNSGNLTKLEVSRNGKCAGAASGTCSQSFYYSWDEVGRLVRARRWDLASVPANFASPAVDLQYHYAAGDSRVLKTARAPNTPEVHTAYIFPGLELRRAQFNTATSGDYTLDSATEVAYLFANGVRLARLVHQPVTSAGDGVLLRVFFELGDHLGSGSVALDKASGELVERSTYQVYGGAESSYRPSKWGDFREDYRFTGKEEDVEVGLTYFGKRFYNALLQRWASPDPLEVHEVGESGEPNLYSYVSGTTLRNVDPLGLCFGSNSCGSGDAPKVFDTVLSSLRKFGLPTSYLNAVSAPSNGIRVGTGVNEYTPFTNRLTLSTDVQQGLDYVNRRASGSDTVALGGTTAVRTLYHEATHAYFDLYKSNREVSAVIARETAYFRGSTLQNGDPVTDPERVFQEAAADYVGGRAAAYYSAQIDLNNALRLHEAGKTEAAIALVGQARASYNDAMKETVVGYQDRGVPFFKVQEYGTKPISSELKNFLDSRVLEGRVKEDFDQVADFADTASQIEGNSSETKTE